MLRAAALSLMLFVSFAVTLPLADSLAKEFNNRSSYSAGKRRYRKHSRAWWRRYRARMARRRAELARQRALAALREQNPVAVEGLNSETASTASNAVAGVGGIYNDPQGQWSLKLPRGWSNRPTAQNGEMQFRVYERGGKPVGQAAFSFVTSARPQVEAEASARQRKLLFAGIPLADLRSAVINKMMQAGGFVSNDLEREIGGRRVYIVLAQTPASSDGRTPEQHWTFYFTEIDGRIYSLGVRASRDTVERIDAEAQQVLTTLRTGNR